MPSEPTKTRTREVQVTHAMVLGDLLREHRMKMKHSQTDVAARAGVTQSTLSRVERGQAEASLYVLRSIANALGVPLWGLLRIADERWDDL